ncbi:glycoside hydrolase family 108 protein [Deinococcus actinosclerus]|uniref:TtsA-like Glycoside hydrolase family 108 domain-containing protein n=1 Tax=Deinococcus actinosclerus TaxID=1768108 RepID=A0ABN4K929_9DEIO|nr:glycosyl hydrolase 108 family protein [Deinococcus actinosclerus]ALW89606.1 hypothetical protein AUC44_12455 [Deinococcus actinosclerus]
MTTDFEKAHEFTAKWEGGYVNHPADKGGPTNLGVTQAVWESWCRERGLPVKPMRALTLPDVLPLYEARYWPAASGLPWPLSGVAYDIAVNHGPGNLRLMLGSVPATGTPAERADRLIDAREQFFRKIVKARPSQEVFLKGWLRRVAAQRDWLDEQAVQPAVPRVFLRDMAGKNVEWDGKPTIYNGTRLTLYPDGALQLERE